MATIAHWAGGSVHNGASIGPGAYSNEQEARQQNIELAKQVDMVQRSLARQTRELESEQTENRALTEELTNSKTRLTETETDLNNVNEDLERAKEAQESVQQDLQTEQSKNKSLADQIAKLQEENKTLQDKVTALEPPDSKASSKTRTHSESDGPGHDTGNGLQATPPNHFMVKAPLPEKAPKRPRIQPPP